MTVGGYLAGFEDSDVGSMERVLRNRLGVSRIMDDKEAVTLCGLGSESDKVVEADDDAAASGIEGTKNGILLNILSSLSLASFDPDAHHDAKLAGRYKIQCLISC